MQTDMLRPYCSELKRITLALEDLADLTELKLKSGTEKFTAETMLASAMRLRKVAEQLEKAVAGADIPGG